MQSLVRKLRNEAYQVSKNPPDVLAKLSTIHKPGRPVLLCIKWIKINYARVNTYNSAPAEKRGWRGFDRDAMAAFAWKDERASWTEDESARVSSNQLS